jgi:hypothetical protein
VERERKEQSGKKTREWRTCWKVAVVMRKKGDGSKVEKQIKKKKAKAWEKLLKDKETQSNQQRRTMK